MGFLIGCVRDHLTLNDPGVTRAVWHSRHVRCATPTGPRRPGAGGIIAGLVEEPTSADDGLSTNADIEAPTATDRNIGDVVPTEIDIGVDSAAAAHVCTDIGHITAAKIDVRADTEAAAAVAADTNADTRNARATKPDIRVKIQQAAARSSNADTGADFKSVSVKELRRHTGGQRAFHKTAPIAARPGQGRAGGCIEVDGACIRSKLNAGAAASPTGVACGRLRYRRATLWRGIRPCHILTLTVEGRDARSAHVRPHERRIHTKKLTTL
ncbi:hypothetical protein HKCCE4037_02330 [Rhodobacterales bacterium HKCCE4037]|nr:hypothetical protein [Rhodobacterales bacterium HKCCE4037]